MQDHTWYRPGDAPKDGEPDTRPGFRIRMASLIERGEFDAELEGRHSAGSVPSFIMLDTAIAGVNALLEGEEAAEIAELLRGFHSAPGEEVSDTDRAQIAEIEEVLKKSWPPYRQLLEQSARYRNLMPLLAFRRFVDDFENVTDRDGKVIAFERDKSGQVAEALLRRLHPALLYAAGNRAYSFQYAAGEEKN
jgi:hypothetical protein